MEELNQYLVENYNANIIVNIQDDEDYDYHDTTLTKLILAYGASERKEGYKKGFEDGENADG